MRKSNSFSNGLAALALSVPLVLGVGGCKGDGGGSGKDDICEATIRTEPGRVGLGDYTMDMPDTHSPVEDLDFEYYNGHKGGAGDTLVMNGCDGGVHMIFAYDSLTRMFMTEGWKGEMDTGSKLGDTYTDFYDKNYGYKRGRTVSSGRICRLNGQIKVYFTDTNWDAKITEISLRGTRWHSNSDSWNNCY